MFSFWGWGREGKGSDGRRGEIRVVVWVWEARQDHTDRCVAHELQCSSEGYKRKHMVSQNHGYSICTYLGF
jgi:hypothetical protein